jgi:hypothetical protein
VSTVTILLFKSTERKGNALLIEVLMPSRLRRFQESGQSHFLTFSCHRRQASPVLAAAALEMTMGGG